MKLSHILLVDPSYFLDDYKAGFAIPYSLIRWTKMAAESTSFQIRTYHALWQAKNNNKVCCLPFFCGAELCTCHQGNREQQACTDLSVFVL